MCNKIKKNGFFLSFSLAFLGRDGMCEQDDPRVGGVIPKGLQAFRSRFQLDLLITLRTLLDCEIGVKLKGPTKETLCGPNSESGSDHSIYFDASGI